MAKQASAAARKKKKGEKSNSEALGKLFKAAEDDMQSRPSSVIPYSDKEASEDLAFLMAYRKRNP